MKNLNFKILLVLITGLFLFSCSNENDVIDQVGENIITAEDAAFQDLLAQLEILNAEYATVPQTRAIGGEDARLAKTFSIISTDALGGVMGFKRSLFENIISSIAASLKAYTLSGANVSPNIEPWISKSLSNTYLKNINMSPTIGVGASDFDEAGNAHNLVIDKLYKKYGMGLVNLPDMQLQDAIVKKMIEIGYKVPDTYNPSYPINFSGITRIIQNNDYAKSLGWMLQVKYITANEYNTLLSFFKGLKNLADFRKVMDYCVSFRNTVNNSGISPASRSNICSVVSIGFGSANLWE